MNIAIDIDDTIMDSFDYFIPYLAEYFQVEAVLQQCQYDDYDRLIQLCDCLAGSEGVMDMETRMADVKRRYGQYPQEKWDMNMQLKQLFEERTGKNIYDVVED